MEVNIVGKTNDDVMTILTQSRKESEKTSIKQLLGNEINSLQNYGLLMETYLNRINEAKINLDLKNFEEHANGHLLSGKLIKSMMTNLEEINANINNQLIEARSKIKIDDNDDMIDYLINKLCYEFSLSKSNSIDDFLNKKEKSLMSKLVKTEFLNLILFNNEDSECKLLKQTFLESKKLYKQILKNNINPKDKLNKLRDDLLIVLSQSSLFINPNQENDINSNNIETNSGLINDLKYVLRNLLKELELTNGNLLEFTNGTIINIVERNDKLKLSLEKVMTENIELVGNTNYFNIIDKERRLISEIIYLYNLYEISLNETLDIYADDDIDLELGMINVTSDSTFKTNSFIEIIETIKTLEIIQTYELDEYLKDANEISSDYLKNSMKSYFKSFWLGEQENYTESVLQEKALSYFQNGLYKYYIKIFYNYITMVSDKVIEPVKEIDALINAKETDLSTYIDKIRNDTDKLVYSCNFTKIATEKIVKFLIESKIKFN